MTYDPNKHHRRSIRLKEYTYTTPGAYFVTICTHRHVCLFGDIVDGQVTLNAYGDIVEEEWERTGAIRQEIDLDSWIVMPNHFHAVVHIVAIDDGWRRGARHCAPTRRTPDGHSPAVEARSLGSVVRGFKSAVTRRINYLRRTPGAAIWQRNYYEHIIRNETDLNAIREYTVNNPMRWADDPDHPANLIP